MMKAELCPVCRGSGDYRGRKCHGCEGKGWVVLSMPEDVFEYRFVPCRCHPAPIFTWDTTCDTHDSRDPLIDECDRYLHFK